MSYAALFHRYIYCDIYSYFCLVIAFYQNNGDRLGYFTSELLRSSEMIDDKVTVANVFFKYVFFKVDYRLLRTWFLLF